MLVWGLGWKLKNASDNRRPPSSKTLAPTWSWASVDGQCVYQGGLNFKEYCNVLHIELPNSDGFPRERRALGCITLQVALKSASSSRGGFDVSVAGRSFGKDFTLDCAFCEGEEAGESLHCFSLCSYDDCQIELVVRCVDSSLQLYERIGIIWTRNRPVGGMEAIINLV